MTMHSTYYINTSMTKQELWRKYCEANPSFVNNKTVTMSTAGLKKLFDQTWDLANQAGQKTAQGQRSAGNDLFNTIFRNI